MPTTSPFRTNPSLGPDLFQVVKDGGAWYEGPGRLGNGLGQAKSPQTGDTAFGDDGRVYMWVEASAAIPVIAAPGTAVTITTAAPGVTPRVTVAAGAGGWYAPSTAFYTGTIAIGDHFWVSKGTAP